MINASVFCRCGASWHGAYVKGAAFHHRKGECRFITHDEYKALHKCRCDECVLLRRQARKAKAEPKP